MMDKWLILLIMFIFALFYNLSIAYLVKHNIRWFDRNIDYYMLSMGVIGIFGLTLGLIMELI